MELKELNYILVIAQEQSISKAADRLFMAQSSLSQFLTKFETSMRTKLFVRTTKGVRLTYSGEVFIRYAKHMLQDYHQAENELWDIENLKAGKIEFGISSFRGAYLIPKVLRRFYEAYPNIHVVIHEHNTKELKEMVQQNELDIALLAVFDDDSQLATDKVMQDEIYIVAHGDQPVLQKTHKSCGCLWVNMKDAAPYKFLLSNEDTVLGNIAVDEFKKCQMPIIAVNRNLTAQFALLMAKEGIGLAFTYKSCALPRDNVYYLSIGKAGRYVNLVLKYPEDGYRSKATNLLGKIIREELGK